MNSTSSAILTTIDYIQLVVGVISALGIGGVAGYFIRYSFDQKAEVRRKLRESREKSYQDFLSNLLAFFTGWENEEHKKQFLREVYTKAPLYASDDVIKLAYRFIESHSDIKKNKKSDEAYAELVLAIRKELREIQKEPKTQLKKSQIKIMKVDK